MALLVLNRKRAALKAQLTRLDNYLDEQEEKGSINKTALDLKLKALDKLHLEISDLRTKYYESIPEDESITDVDDALVQIETRLEEMQVRINSFLLKFEPVNEKTVSCGINNTQNIRLPEIPLPKFSGRYDEWHIFKSQFNNVITNNTNLTESQKLHYLRASLYGDAKQVETVDDSFESLFQALEKRFENKRLMVETHINFILEIEEITHESAIDIRKIVDNLNKNIRALKLLKFERNNLSDILLLNVTLRKLDRETRRQFELTIESNEVPNLDKFIAFLERRSQTLDSVNRALPFIHKQKQMPINKSKSLFNSNTSSNCIICKLSQHSIYTCSIFLNMKVSDRFNHVKKLNLCINCLNDQHKVKACRSKNSCSICNKRHHTLLHIFEISTASPQSSESVNGILVQAELKADDSQPNGESSRVFSNCLVAKQQRVLLPTAIVYIKGANGGFLRARALLDSGSELNFVTRETVNKLGLKGEPINASVSGLNEISLSIDQKINTIISNSNGSFTASLDFLMVPTITNVTPLNPVDIRGIKLPSYINLADPDFELPGKIDMLIGCELFFELLNSNQFRSRCGRFLFQQSVFGYIVSGKTEYFTKNLYCGLITNLESIDQQMREFWEIETLEEPSNGLSLEEEICESQFKNTHYRNEDGRYVVQLPIKGDPNILGNSRTWAETMLNQLWKKLSRNEELKYLYTSFLVEYAELQHMELVQDNHDNESIKYFLPHHGVFRPDKDSTKLRVVFNASASTTSGVSLNDILYKGGTIQQDLFSILLRFRQHNYVFTADITKMFRQILIHQDHQNLQQILWKDSLNGPIKTYKLKTVTYGTTCAPYLATRTIQQLAYDERENCPLAASVILRNIYMDDILTGCSDLKTAKLLQSQLIELFQRGGMKLHKWCSNTPEILDNIPKEDQAYSFHCEASDKAVKTLGILWNPKSDCFGYKVSIVLKNSYTKRDILSHIARLFDPLGLIGPIITKAKIFMQKLWILKLGWDEQLPDPVAKEWHAFVSTLTDIEEIHIPRLVLEQSRVVIHGFADASAAAYGAVIYVQSFSAEDTCTKLLCSKSRVAPIKTVTIPRLELCACVLLSKLLDKVLQSLTVKIDHVMLWTDSSIVLAWMKRSPFQLKTFIGNRVATIQELTRNCQWNHVPSESNPADIISRGSNASEFSSYSLWWNGPDFLQRERVVADTDVKDITANGEYLREIKITSDSFMNTKQISFVNDILKISNNYTKLLYVLSYIFRFINNCKNLHDKRSGKIVFKELNEAELFLIRDIQQAAFKEELRNLIRGNAVSGKSKLIALNPYIDGNQIIRVGGRLSYSNLNYSQKHPAIIPSDHPLTRIIITHMHKKNLHVGPQALLYSVRQKFWPIHGRSLTRKIVHECIVCFKNKPIIAEQLMGSLPKERVNPSFTFQHTGIDFCGPFHIKYKNQRKGVFQKIYVAIFVCFTTKAVHLETVSDLTTDSFIASLKRFVARRGKCATIYSDNAKNFVGANLELKRLHKMLTSPDDQLATYLSSEGIEWRFLPPRSPNFGGLWEAGVKSFKFHLKRVIGNLKLTYEEFLTVTTQIEGILNSRPLTPLSADIDDLEALTPGHFLIGRPINAIGEPNLLYKPEHALTRWQKLTKFVQYIWRKWSRDYLNNLQQRNKWKFEKQEVKIDSLVLIKEDNLSICNWVLGRIVKVFPGTDGKIRVVEIKTKNGILKRSIGRVCILPLEN